MTRPVLRPLVLRSVVLRRFVLPRFVLLLVFLTAFVTAPASLHGQAGDAMTNDDVIKMVRAELSTTIILSTINAAPAVAFDVTPAGLVALKTAGVSDALIEAMMAKARPAPATPAASASASSREPPALSSGLATSKDREELLRTFKTMVIDASQAKFFGPDQVTAGLGRNKDFARMNITVVTERSVADVVLEVGYTFAWDFPFVLKHQTSAVVLVSGKGTGPFSGPAGAKDVANELVKLLKPYRVPAARK